MSITTTLNRIRAHIPCREGWEKLLKGLGKTAADDEPLPFARVVEINGLDDALWCCRAEPQHDRQWRLYAVWCARQVQRFMKDQRSIAAINVAERYANGLATDEELVAAREAVWAAREVTWDGWEAAWEAAWATRVAAWDAAWAAWATRVAAWDTARDTTREAQTAEFLRVVNGGEQ